ncbi:hypothetical protein TrRE_jg4428 [Triparma retinervis]|uniref:Uncharacterized protein n=1 Tax=Triparma retinervis TaxID=2557542 RepID=A0A9W6ZAJ3_9STRA|nr:hypothetical protein TrRE_jg4428 [Triparma retinervis]
MGRLHGLAMEGSGLARWCVGKECRGGRGRVRKCDVMLYLGRCKEGRGDWGIAEGMVRFRRDKGWKSSCRDLTSVRYGSSSQAGGTEGGKTVEVWEMLWEKEGWGGVKRWKVGGDKREEWRILTGLGE